MAEPQCPQCQIAGIEHIVSKNSIEKDRNQAPWFSVVYCKQCGHVYGVFNKHSFTPATRRPDIKFSLPDH